MYFKKNYSLDYGPSRAHKNGNRPRQSFSLTIHVCQLVSAGRKETVSRESQTFIGQFRQVIKKLENKLPAGKHGGHRSVRLKILFDRALF